MAFLKCTTGGEVNRNKQSLLREGSAEEVTINMRADFRKGAVVLYCAVWFRQMVVIQ